MRLSAAAPHRRVLCGSNSSWANALQNLDLLADAHLTSARAALVLTREEVRRSCNVFDRADPDVQHVAFQEQDRAQPDSG
jgi:hypothetical protein